jgi:hypothetical protein
VLFASFFISFSPLKTFFLRETRDGSEAFSGAQQSRAPARPRSSQTLDGEHRWKTLFLKHAGEVEKKRRQER